MTVIDNTTNVGTPTKYCSVCGSKLVWNSSTGWNCTNTACIAI